MESVLKVTFVICMVFGVLGWLGTPPKPTPSTPQEIAAREAEQLERQQTEIAERKKQLDEVFAAGRARADEILAYRAKIARENPMISTVRNGNCTYNFDASDDPRTRIACK